MSLELFVEQAFKRGKHDSIVYNLEKRLNNSNLYDNIKHCAEYSNRPDKTLGETDIIAVAGNRMFLFEIKSNKNSKTRKHANYQLNRTEKFVNEMISKDYKFYKFYVTGIPFVKGYVYNIQRVNK